MKPMTPPSPENGWRTVCRQQVLQVHRTGWPGAWDALLAAITGHRRMTTPAELTVSVMVKSEDPVCIAISNQKVAVICKR